MSTHPCIIIGSGGHAKVVIDVLRQMDRTILFATSDNPSASNAQVSGVPIIGDDSCLETYEPDDIDLTLGVGAPKLGDLRQKVWAPFAKRGFQQVTLIHPSAVISTDVTLDEGAQIMAGATIQPGCHIGKGAIINTGATVDHDCHIGNFAHVAPGVTLCGSVKVGENSLVGAGVTATPGINIGKNCHISAGAAISLDVADGLSVCGNPVEIKKVVAN